MAHVFFVVIGMGGALIADILFNFYVKDKNINPTENTTLQFLSKIIWVSLAMIVLSGLSIFLSDPLQYAYSAKFVIKMIIVTVLILNGLLFWQVTHASLTKISFTDTNADNPYVRIRKFSFACGAVSIVSWLSAFVLGSIPSISLTLREAGMAYAGLLVVAILGSQIAEYVMVRKG